MYSPNHSGSREDFPTFTRLRARICPEYLTYWELTDNGRILTGRSTIWKAWIPTGQRILWIGYQSLKEGYPMGGVSYELADTYKAQYPMGRIPTSNEKITARRRIIRIGYPPTVHFQGPLGGAEIFPRVRVPHGRRSKSRSRRFLVDFSLRKCVLYERS